MNLLIEREPEEAAYIQGEFFLPERQHFGYTLDNPTNRPTGDKRPLGYPAATYDLTVRWSNRFGKMMPHIENVPFRSGIEIHGGNTVDGEPWNPTQDDSDGCTLLGMQRVGPGKIATKNTDTLISYLQNTATHITGTGNAQVWSGHQIQVVQK